MESRCSHSPVVETIQFIQGYVFMPYELHHPIEISVLFVPAQHLYLPTASDEYQRRSILPHVVQRRVFIDNWLRVFYPPFGADGHVRDGVSAEIYDEIGRASCRERV